MLSALAKLSICILSSLYIESSLQSLVVGREICKHRDSVYVIRVFFFYLFQYHYLNYFPFAVDMDGIGNI